MFIAVQRHADAEGDQHRNQRPHSRINVTADDQEKHVGIVDAFQVEQRLSLVIGFRDARLADAKRVIVDHVDGQGRAFLDDFPADQEAVIERAVLGPGREFRFVARYAVSMIRATIADQDAGDKTYMRGKADKAQQEPDPAGDGHSEIGAKAEGGKQSARRSAAADQDDAAVPTRP